MSQPRQLSKRPSSAGGARRPVAVDAAIENSRDRLSSWRLHSPDNAAQNTQSRTQKVLQNLKLEAPSFQPCVDKISRKIDAQRHQDSESGSKHRSRFKRHNSLVCIMIISRLRLFFRFEELYSKRIQQSLRKKALAQEQVPFLCINVCTSLFHDLICCVCIRKKKRTKAAHLSPTLEKPNA